MRYLFIIFFFPFLFLNFKINAQSYKASVNNTAYVELQSPSVLTKTHPWANPWFKIPISFKYSYFGKSMDSIYVGAYGLFFTLDQKDLITVALYDAIDRGGSEISYIISGSEGSRILKMQWKNIGFYMDGAHENYYNVQAWLYEGSNNLEVHIGQCSLQNTYSCEYDDDKSILFFDNFDSSEKIAMDSNGNYSNDEVRKSCQVIKNPASGMTCLFEPKRTN